MTPDVGLSPYLTLSSSRTEVLKPDRSCLRAWRRKGDLYGPWKRVRKPREKCKTWVARAQGVA